MRLWFIVALWLPLLLPFGARADDIGPDQAKALQQQLKDWLAGLLGPSVKLPDLPWTITGERDHYVITWPIPGITSPTSDVAATASVRPLDGGRWSIDEVKLPPSASFTMTLPEAGDPGNSAPVDVRFSVGKQETHGVIDPSLASASKLHTEMADLVVSSDSAKQKQEQRFDRYLLDSSLAPTPAGRLDLTMDASVDGWKSASQITTGTAVAIGIHSMRAAGKIGGVNRERVAALLGSAGGLAGALPPDIATKGDKTELTAPARAQLRLMIDALEDVLTEVRLEETLDGVEVEVAGMGGVTLRHVKFGLGGEAPDGKLHAWLDLGLDDPASPSLPPQIAGFLPHHVEIKPSLSGVLTADLHKLALDATDAGADNKSLTPDIDAMFAHGGIDLGIETLAFDLGPAKVDGTGHITMLSQTTWHGEAHLTASGLDELMAQARGDPELQQALPMLIMMRGLGKPDGDRLVWDIASDGPKVTVNGLDLSQLGGADKPKGKPPGQPSKPRKP